jgi:hypothetical protein
MISTRIITSAFPARDGVFGNHSRADIPLDNSGFWRIVLPLSRTHPIAVMKSD